MLSVNHSLLVEAVVELLALLLILCKTRYWYLLSSLHCVSLCVVCKHVQCCFKHNSSPPADCVTGRIAEVFLKSGGKLTQAEPEVYLRLNVFYR